MIFYIEDNHIFGKHEDYKKYMKDFSFYEFTLDELGLPTAEKLLEKILDLEKEVGLHNWKTKNFEFDDYKGFSLTYNKNYVGDQGVFNQTLGTKTMTQVYGIAGEKNLPTVFKDTYYDTYGFRHIHPTVKKHFGDIFDKFNCGIARSRVSYFYPNQTKLPDTSGIHVDELPLFLLRLNIPLKTNSNHVLKSEGTDNYGNTLKFEKHLEVGKAYIWNTIIPHQVTVKEETTDSEPRIHLVLGLTPWLVYNETPDEWVPSPNYKIPLKEIVENKLFLK
jgi:hypothetical protein